MKKRKALKAASRKQTATTSMPRKEVADTIEFLYDHIESEAENERFQ